MKEEIREMGSVNEEGSDLSSGERKSLSKDASRYSQQHAHAVIRESRTRREKAFSKEVVRSAGALTTSLAMVEALQQCQRRTSEINGGMLTPRAYKALYETTKSLINNTSRSQTPTYPLLCGSINEKENKESPTKNTKTSCLNCCCDLDNVKKDSCSRSTQAMLEVMQVCPHHCFETQDEATQENLDTVEEYVKSYLATSCRYYTSMLSKQLDKVRENLRRHLTPPDDGTCKAPSISNFFLEACTMKPSERQDHCCQTIKVKSILSNNLKNLPALTSALSATDFRENRDKPDLRFMYYMLSSIEGRVRRLKQNLLT